MLHFAWESIVCHPSPVPLWIIPEKIVSFLRVWHIVFIRSPTAERIRILARFEYHRCDSVREDEARQPPYCSDDASSAILLVHRCDNYPLPGCVAGKCQAEDVRPTRWVITTYICTTYYFIRAWARERVCRDPVRSIFILVIDINQEVNQLWGKYSFLFIFWYIIYLVIMMSRISISFFSFM